MSLDAFLMHEAVDSVRPPISGSIDTNAEQYLLEKGVKKLGWRAFRRLMAYRLSGQKRYLENNIDRSVWKRCLWLYYDIPQIGDALMDLAPRSMLHDAGISIDLYTHPHLAALFEGDVFFNSVQTDPAGIHSDAYDFVITSTFKWRSLRHKVFYAYKLPWVSIFEKFSGPELNRSLCSAKRIAELLDESPSPSEMEFHACQKLVYEKDSEPQPRYARSVVLAIGGVDPARTYQGWRDVATGLKGLGVERVVLLGTPTDSGNLDEILSTQDASFEVHDYVGKTTLKECRELMRQSSAIIAADGGLMHLAITCNRPVIGLFNRAIDPKWRLPGHLVGAAIQSRTKDVNDIPCSAIIDAIGKMQ